ncbi:MAG TPA: carbon monoxide dehydrogenase [Alphaproteobacteria bacterium]|nr:carbon monoxide dehydrogenase [Alphaproteobacteria bacterium]
MEMSGEFRIPAPKEKVWAALNDPEILRQSVPGCQSITKLSDTEMEGAVTASVGPVKATFKGSVVLSDIDAPNSYTLTGQGKGGAAGFVKGVAKVSLAEESGATVLRYRSEASVGGKLAQIGQRLIDGTAKKLSEEFFGNFSALLGGGAQEAAEVEAPQQAQAVPAAAPSTGGLKPTVWIPVLIVAMTLLLLFFTS